VRDVYKFVPVCRDGGGRKLRSFSAALAAPISAAVRGPFFFFVAASISAFVGGFGGCLWVWVPVLMSWPLTNLYPSECIQTPFTSDHPSGKGVAGISLGSSFTFLLDCRLEFREGVGLGSALSATVPVKLEKMSRAIIFLSILNW
jgi:hypothetical protein